MSNLWWISWNQAADPQHGLDSRPVGWPPPDPVLAFWESGYAGDGSYTTVVALVRAPTDAKACRVVKRAWQIKSESPWRFCREYKISDGPPTGRFPVPAWSVELGRWPWKMEAA